MFVAVEKDALKLLKIQVQYSDAIRRTGLSSSKDALLCIGMLLEEVYVDLVEQNFVVPDTMNVKVF